MDSDAFQDIAFALRTLTFTYQGSLCGGRLPYNPGDSLLLHGRGILMAHEGNGLHRVIFDGNWKHGYGVNAKTCSLPNMLHKNAVEMAITYVTTWLNSCDSEMANMT